MMVNYGQWWWMMGNDVSRLFWGLVWWETHHPVYCGSQSWGGPRAVDGRAKTLSGPKNSRCVYVCLLTSIPQPVVKQVSGYEDGYLSCTVPSSTNIIDHYEASLTVMTHHYSSSTIVAKMQQFYYILVPKCYFNWMIVPQWILVGSMLLLPINAIGWFQWSSQAIAVKLIWTGHRAIC